MCDIGRKHCSSEGQAHGRMGCDSHGHMGWEKWTLGDGLKDGQVGAHVKERFEALGTAKSR